MGTDIHLAVQRRRDDRWERVERVVPNPYFDPADEDGSPETQRESLYEGRHYVVFAALAGVRNGEGFAGCVTHVPLIPVAPYRGLPEDFEAEMAGGYYHEGTSMGDHSFTWMTLAEIEAYKWDQILVRSGWVSAPVRLAQLKAGLRRPSEWCGGIGGPGIRHISIAQMDAEIKAGNIDDRAYAELTWDENLKYVCAGFLNLLPALRALAPSSDDVRLVMGFDS